MTGQPLQLYLLDANVYITAHRLYYAFDLCSGFWDCLIRFSNSGRTLSIDRVRGELHEQDDALSRWVDADCPAGMFVNSLESAVTDSYREVIRWVYANRQFTIQAKNEFSRGADGWLAAYARTHDMILVTLERYAPEARSKVPLPNVCRQFGVPYVDTFEMLRELGVRFDWLRFVVDTPIGRWLYSTHNHLS